MSFARTQQTAALIVAARRLKIAKQRRRVPKQIPPRRIEDQYTKRLREFVVPRVRHAFLPFVEQIPHILASAHAAIRLDALRMDVGEGKSIRELIAQARERMKRTIITSDLENLASLFASNTATYQKQQFARQTKAALGIDPFIQDRRLMPLTQAFIDANVGLITKLTDDVAGRIETSALSAIQDGTLWPDYQADLEKSFGMSETRAELIARDQIGKAYGQINSARQRELGVDKFIWRTSEDERVRPEHEALDGQTFSYDDPPDEGLPGEPILCRCTAEPDFSSILDATDDVPEDPSPKEQEQTSGRSAPSDAPARARSTIVVPASVRTPNAPAQQEMEAMARRQLQAASLHVSEHESQQAIEELSAQQRIEREHFGIGIGQRIGEEVHATIEPITIPHNTPPTPAPQKPIDIMHNVVPTLAPAEPILELPELPPEPAALSLPAGWEFTQYNGATYVHVPGENGTRIPYKDVVAGHFSLTPRPTKPIKRGLLSRLRGRWLS